jgi:integrase
MRQIKPTSNNGSIRFRFRHNGLTYSFNLQDAQWGTPADMARATAIAALITADIAAGRFDRTLIKYKQLPPVLEPPMALLEVWDRWVNSKQLSAFTLANNYAPLRRALIAGKYLHDGLSPAVWNTRLMYIRTAYRLSPRSRNPFESYQRKREPRKQVSVFTASELTAIAQAFDAIAPHHSKFIRFLMISGCRLGEASGLLKSDVNPLTGSITIQRTLRYNRATREHELSPQTKTGLKRVLRSKQLTELAYDASAPEYSLCFTSQRGGLLHPSNFHKKAWVPALKLAGVPYRRLHVLRHTALSRALEAGLTPPQVAQMAGHVDAKQIISTYGHVITPASVPEIDI